MMHTYQVHCTRNFIRELLLGGAVSGLFLSFGLFGILTEGSIGAGIVAVVGVYVLWLTFHWAWSFPQQPWVVEVADDGTVVFVPRRGESRALRVDDIAQVHIWFTRDGEGGEVWKLELRDSSGHGTEIDYFEQAPAFVEELLALNSHIAVTGQWPRR